MSDSLLFKKVYGALIGAAIGDAMGGVVEGFSYQKIQEKYGVVDTLLPYDEEIAIAVHGPFALQAGSYTDDSRMAKIFAQAMIEKGAVANSHDLAKAFAQYYFNATTDLEKDFIEEYYNKGIYRETKEIFGGQPTNGAIMGIAPYGVIAACDPERAHDDAFEAMFTTVGYARYAASMAAAAIAAAMKQGATCQSVVEEMMKAVKKHKARVEGPGWADCHMYPYVGRKTEKLVEDCLEATRQYDDILEVRPRLYETVVQEFFADGAESLAIAVTFFVLAKGDFTKTVTGCVNFGRDNDSSASIAGAMAGALGGVDAIPSEWVDLVETVNPGPTFRELAQGLCAIIEKECTEKKAVVNQLEQLL